MFMTKIQAMCKIINIRGDMNAKQNENKICKYDFAIWMDPTAKWICTAEWH